jgi:hypothetical protein
VTDDDSGAPDGAAPKLTMAQRLLTALPNLQREPAPRAPVRPRAGRSAPPSDATDSTDSTDTADWTDTDDGHDAHDATTSDVDTNSARPTTSGRIRDALLKPGPATNRARPTEVLAEMSREEIAHRIKKLDDRERLLALCAAPLGAVVGILLTAITIHANPAVHQKNHVAESTILFEGGARILLSGLVALAAMSRRRSLVGFALLFLGTSMGSPLFALPFWGLGGYLIWRVFKYQRVLTARGGASARSRGGASARSRGGASARSRGGASARSGGGASGRSGSAGRVPANPRAAARAGAASARDRAQSPRQRGRKQPAPTGPTPSKRYTPPKPVRPRPPAPPT